MKPMHVVQVAYTGSGPWRDVFKSSDVDAVRGKMHAFEASPLYAGVRVVMVEEEARREVQQHQQ